MTRPIAEEEGVPTAISMSDMWDRERAKLARKWAYMVSMTAYLPMPHTEVERHLLDLVHRLYDAIASEPLATEHAADVGARLVELHCVGKTSLQCTVDVLAGALLADPVLVRVDRLGERVARLLGSLASGYVDALRSSTIEQRDDLNRALLEAVVSAERSRKASEARLDEVLICSESGIAITDLDGRIERANPAFDLIANRTAAEVTLFEVIHPDDRHDLRQAYRNLFDGDPKRLRLRPRLLREDDEIRQVSLAASVLNDAAGRPSHYVTIVADDTELSLLRGRLSHQLLHDVLTGLPNRQFLTTRLEHLLRAAAPVTLYHLVLDGFALISDGFGRRVSDQLLHTVAERLTALFAEEKAMVARLDGARFVVLMENSPAPAVMVEKITAAMVAPVPAQGGDVATSVSIGVVHRPRQPVDPAELLRAADMALRQAQRKGPGQWAVLDLDRDVHDRRTFRLAATMPGAWRAGQLRVVYQPIVRLADYETVGVEPLLQWDQPEYGSLPHHRCLELAERNGLVIALGAWLLGRASERIRRSARDLLLAVNLTPDQSAHPELVGAVLRTLDRTGLPPGQLRLAMPAAELLADQGHAADNLRLLADAGVQTAVHEFGSLPGDLACLEDLPVHAVRLAPRLVRRQARQAVRDTLTAKAATQLATFVHATGATMTVDGIQAAPQADWWHRTGADTATGPLFCPGGPRDDIAALLTE
jgi:diguanylate cyclase (GGDEF)-like protein/PAS domain S-box-containing protein